MHRKGLSGELRRAPAGALHGRRQVGRARGAGAGLLAPRLRHRARRVSGRPPARHRHRRRAERAADRERRGGRPLPMFVSDFFDFSIYVDAQEADIEQWYVERFLTLRETVFQNPSSYFHRYAALTPAAGDRDGARHLADDQPGQPARERPADARARPPDPGKGARPRGAARAAAEAVATDAAWPVPAPNSLASSGADVAAR